MSYIIRNAGVILSHHTSVDDLYAAFDSLPRALKHSCVLERHPASGVTEGETAKEIAARRVAALTKAKQEARTDRIVRR